MKQGRNLLQVKYFGLIIDYKDRRVIYGGWGTVATIENFTGPSTRQFTTSQEFQSELSSAIEGWHGWWRYDGVKAAVVWKVYHTK